MYSEEGEMEESEEPTLRRHSYTLAQGDIHPMEVELTQPQHSEKDELEGSLERTPQQQEETVDQKVNI